MKRPGPLGGVLLLPGGLGHTDRMCLGTQGWQGEDTAHSLGKGHQPWLEKTKN